MFYNTLIFDPGIPYGCPLKEVTTAYLKHNCIPFIPLKDVVCMYIFVDGGFRNKGASSGSSWGLVGVTENAAGTQSVKFPALGLSLIHI